MTPEPVRDEAYGEQPSGSPSLVEWLLAVLLVFGFFLGPLKLLGNSWLSYVGVDALALVALILVFGRRMIGKRPLFASSPISVPIILLGIYCLIELGNPEAPFVRSVLGLRSWLLYLAFFFVGFYTLRTTAQIQRLYALLIALGVITALYGVYQWQAGPEAFATWSDQYGRYAPFAWSATPGGVIFRAFSTFVAAGTFGGNMAMLMLLAFSLAASPRMGWWIRLGASLAFAVMGAGIAASGSRGPLVHLLIAVAVGLVLVPGSWARLALASKGLAMLCVAAMAVLFVIGPAVNDRFLTIFDPQAFFWKWFWPLTEGIRIAVAHPFGVGLGYTAGVPKFITSPALQQVPTLNIDSGYGSAAAELGFVGLILFVYLAVKIGLEGPRAWNRLPQGKLRDLILGPALLAGTYPIVSVIFQPQASLPSSIYFWLLIGALMKAPSLGPVPDANPLSRATLHTRQ